MALFNQILIADDFSPCARQALAYGAAMAVQFHANVLIAHVYKPLVVSVPDAVIPVGPADEHQVIAKLHAGLAEAAAAARKLGVAGVETVLLEGQPWHELVRLAHDRKCDLVVIGTHGRGAVGHFLLGSVAERVVRKAGCPVLVIGKTSKDS